MLNIRKAQKTYMHDEYMTISVDRSSLFIIYTSNVASTLSNKLYFSMFNVVSSVLSISDYTTIVLIGAVVAVYVSITAVMKINTLAIGASEKCVLAFRCF